VRIVDDPVRTGDSQATYRFVSRESACCAVHSREYLLRRPLSVVCEGDGIDCPLMHCVTGRTPEALPKRGE
jgi:hypothetical protein